MRSLVSKLPWWAFRVGSCSDFLLPHCLAQLPNSTVENKLALGQKYNLLPLTHSYLPTQRLPITMPYVEKFTNTKELWRRLFIMKTATWMKTRRLGKAAPAHQAQKHFEPTGGEPSLLGENEATVKSFNLTRKTNILLGLHPFPSFV